MWKEREGVFSCAAAPRLLVLRVDVARRDSSFNVRRPVGSRTCGQARGPAQARQPRRPLCPLRQVVLASGGGHLVYLEVGEGALVEAAHRQLDAEIACLDVTPAGGSVPQRGIVCCSRESGRGREARPAGRRSAEWHSRGKRQGERGRAGGRQRRGRGRGPGRGVLLRMGPPWHTYLGSWAGHAGSTARALVLPPLQHSRCPGLTPTPTPTHSLIRIHTQQNRPANPAA